MENRYNDSTKKVRVARRLAPMLAISLGLGIFAPAFGQQAQQPETLEAAGPSRASSPMDLSSAFIEVAKRAKPIVVHVIMGGGARQGTGTPQGPGQQPIAGTGSGVLVSPDGYILTNKHVAGMSDGIRVKLYDGRELSARRVGMDTETDLALIKIEAQNLPYARLGDSSRLQQGEWVIALGSPFGLEQTMTVGIVSATGRTFGGMYDNYIQTDASINPGNSGGPLLNLDGEVVGINSMIYSNSGKSEGVGFSIPSNIARNVKDQLLAKGKVTRGFLGANLRPVSPAAAGSGGQGAMIGDLTPNGPASKSGLQSGDVILEFDGKSVTTPKQLTEMVADTQVGKSVPLKFVRGGKETETTLTLAERPGSVAAENRTAPAPYGQQRRP
jgi:serine protease Do